MENIVNKLISVGYPEAAAKIVAEKLSALSGNLKIAADTWVNTGIQSEIASNGYSTLSLMQRFQGMTYPAALLTIDWLNRDPENAIKSIERGIR